jgi:hypothetical protein
MVLLLVAEQVVVVPQNCVIVPGTVIDASGKVTVRAVVCAKVNVVAVDAVAPDRENCAVLLGVVVSAMRGRSIVGVMIVGLVCNTDAPVPVVEPTAALAT